MLPGLLRYAFGYCSILVSRKFIGGALVEWSVVDIDDDGVFFFFFFAGIRDISGCQLENRIIISYLFQCTDVMSSQFELLLRQNGNRHVNNICCSKPLSRAQVEFLGRQFTCWQFA